MKGKVQFLCSLFIGQGDCSCMKDDQHQFLTLLGQLPARLTAEQAGWVLGCQPHDIPALMTARLLKPLGNPSQNSVKFFAAVDVLELLRDRSWLHKMTQVINQHWQQQNARKRAVPQSNGQNYVLATVNGR